MKAVGASSEALFFIPERRPMKKQSKNKPQTILFQGDSITDCGRSATGGAGYPAIGLGPGYPGLIGSRLWMDQPSRHWNIINRGISGNRVVDLYARWLVDGINLGPDIVSILIGVNDTWHHFGNNNGVDVPRYDEFYRRLLDWTLEELPKVKFVLLEPFVLTFGAVNKTWLKEIRQRQQVVAKIAADYQTVFVPLQEPFNKAVKLADPAYWLVDGVHPTPAGHQLIADAWLTAAKSLLA